MRPPSILFRKVLIPSGLLLTSACERTGHENAPDRLPAEVAATISAPRVVIGREDGGEPHSLHRVFGAVLFPSGIAIGNSGTGEVRFFGMDGRHAFSTGRRGAGPGEFGSINWMGRLPGDSILVWDMRGARFTVLAPEGRFNRTFRLQRASQGSHPIGILPDGTVVLAEQFGYDPRAPAGSVLDAIVLLRVALNGEVLDSLAEIPGSEWLLYDHASSYRAVRLPLGRTAYATVTGSLVAYASSGSPTVTLLDSSGRVVSTRELPIEPVQLTARDRNRIIDAEVEDPVERSAIKRHFASAGGSAPPLITDLRGDTRGNVWVRTLSKPEEDTVGWLVVPTTGTAIGRVMLPAGATPLDIRGDSVLLREIDDDGIERMTVRELVQ